MLYTGPEFYLDSGKRSFSRLDLQAVSARCKEKQPLMCYLVQNTDVNGSFAGALEDIFRRGAQNSGKKQSAKSDAIVHMAGHDIHFLKPSRMSSGQKQQMTDNLRAVVKDKSELAVCWLPLMQDFSSPLEFERMKS